jgi:uncharacterized protein
VLRLELFGSASNGTFDFERSDVDFLVEFLANYDFGPWLSRHFRFRDQLVEIVHRPVDLVMIDAPRNPYFIRSVNATRQLLYAA